MLHNNNCSQPSDDAVSAYCVIIIYIVIIEVMSSYKDIIKN